MGTINPIFNEVFFFRVEMSIITNPAVKWHSTYAAEVTAALLTRTELDTLAQSLGDFHQAIGRNNTQIERVVVSAAVEVPNLPTTPDDFYVYPLNLVGARTMGSSDWCDLDVVLHLRRQVQTGHWGHLYLRGILTEADVTAPSGKLALASVGAYDSIINSALVDSALQDYMTYEGAAVGLNLCTYKPGGLLASAVVKWIGGLQVVNATRRKFNVRYYDRS